MKKILLFVVAIIVLSGCASKFEKSINSFPQLTLPYTLDFFGDSVYTFEVIDSTIANEFFRNVKVKDGAEEYVYATDYLDLFFTKNFEFESVSFDVVGSFKEKNFTGVLMLLDVNSDIQPLKMLLLYTFDKEGNSIDACVISSCYVVPNGWEPSMQEAFIEIEKDLTITNSTNFSSYSRNDPEAEPIEVSNEYKYKIDEQGKISF